MARIAVGGFQHETNTFAPQRATWDDFARADAWPGFIRGPELIPAVHGYNITIAGAILDDLAAYGALDGIYLDLHGAMVAEHCEDGEGELLRRIRALVGDKLPIVTS